MDNNNITITESNCEYISFDELQELLFSLEWSGTTWNEDGNPKGCCPLCSYEKANFGFTSIHKQDCKLENMIKIINKFVNKKE